MRFGVFPPAYVVPGEPPPTAAFLGDYARRAEDVGFDGVWVFDHLFDAPPSYRVVFMEPITTLALMIPATRRITVGTGILVLPLRDPVVTAKEIANLDVASEGRVVFGVGVGWDEREFQACQVPKTTRGRRMDEMLEIITGMWTQEAFSYRGSIFTIPEVKLMPRPAQKPRPPILVAGGTVPRGTSKHITTSRGYDEMKSIRRAARLGDGIMTAYRACPGVDASELVRTRELLMAEVLTAGRDPATIRFAHQDHLYIDMDPTPDRLRAALARFSFNRFEDTAPLYLMGHPEQLIPRLQARIDAGVDEITFGMLSSDPRQLDLFMKEVRPQLRQRAR